MSHDFNNQGTLPAGRAVEPPPVGKAPGSAPKGADKATGYDKAIGNTQPKARNNGIKGGPFIVDKKGL